MLPYLMAVFSICSSDARRIIDMDVGASLHLGAMEKHNIKFGASCADLQAAFHNHAIQLETLRAAEPEGQMDRITQVRYDARIMRMLRTIRRARSCPWVRAQDDESKQLMTTVFKTAFSPYRCGQPFMAEVAHASNASSEDRDAMVVHAFQIAASPDCDAGTGNLPAFDELGKLDQEEIESMFISEEEEIEDRLDGVLTESENTTTSLIQTISQLDVMPILMLALFMGIFCPACLVGAVATAVVALFIMCLVLWILWLPNPPYVYCYHP